MILDILGKPASLKRHIDRPARARSTATSARPTRPRELLGLALQHPLRRRAGAHDPLVPRQSGLVAGGAGRGADGPDRRDRGSARSSCSAAGPAQRHAIDAAAALGVRDDRVRRRPRRRRRRRLERGRRTACGARGRTRPTGADRAGHRLARADRGRGRRATSACRTRSAAGDGGALHGQDRAAASRSTRAGVPQPAWSTTAPPAYPCVVKAARPAGPAGDDDRRATRPAWSRRRERARRGVAQRPGALRGVRAGARGDGERVLDRRPRFVAVAVTDRDALRRRPRRGPRHVYPRGRDGAVRRPRRPRRSTALGITAGPELRAADPRPPTGPRVMEVAARLGGGHDSEICRAAGGRRPGRARRCGRRSAEPVAAADAAAARPTGAGVIEFLRGAAGRARVGRRAAGGVLLRCPGHTCTARSASPPTGPGTCSRPAPTAQEALARARTAVERRPIRGAMSSARPAAACHRRRHARPRQRCSTFSPPMIGDEEIESVVATLRVGLAHVAGRASRELEERFADAPGRRARDRDVVVHRRRCTWRSWPRARRRRRGGHELVHLAGDRERDPARRRDAGVRRRRPGHAEPRPGRRRGGRSRRARARCCRCTSPAGRATWTPWARSRAEHELRDHRGRRARGRGRRCAGRKVGSIGDFTCFSLYATKSLAGGEGGIITTASDGAAERLRLLRAHGITRDPWRRAQTRTLGPLRRRRARVQGQPGRPAGGGRAAQVRPARRSSAPTGPTLVRALRRRAGGARRDRADRAARRTARHAHHLYVVRIDPAAGGRRPRPLRGRAHGREHRHRPALPAGAHAHVVPRATSSRVPLPATERAGAEVLSLPLAAAHSERRRRRRARRACARCTPRLTRGDEPAHTRGGSEALVSAVLLGRAPALGGHPRVVCTTLSQAPTCAGSCRRSR